jgi:hypothetical protein
MTTPEVQERQRSSCNIILRRCRTKIDVFKDAIAREIAYQISADESDMDYGAMLRKCGEIEDLIVEIQGLCFKKGRK